MDRALYLPEILDRLFGFCELRKTQAACALVCKKWRDPALRQLWRELDSIKPLMELLAPIDIRGDPRSAPWEFTRFLQPSDWVRFRAYASYVRELHILASSIGFQSSTNLIAEIALSNPNWVGGLLPGLRKLIWATPFHSTNELRVLRFFLSPSINHIMIGIDTKTSRLIQAFPFIGEQCPALSTLRLQGRTPKLPTPAGDPLFHSWLQYQNNLEHLYITPRSISSGLMGAVGKLSNLETLLETGPLNFNDWNSSALPALDYVDVPQATSSLKVLGLEIQLVSFSNILLRRSAVVGLTSLAIVTQVDAIDDLRDFFAALPEGTPGLKNLVFIAGGSPHSEDSKFGLKVDDLLPLFKLSKLETFGLLCPDALDLTATEYKSIAEGFPNIEGLCLAAPYWRAPPTSYPSLEVLVEFAKHCPNLAELGLNLDARLPCPSLDTLWHTTGDALDPTLQKTAFTKLECLFLPTSPMEDENMVPVAEFLFELTWPYPKGQCGPLPPTLEINAEPVAGTEPFGRQVQFPHPRDARWNSVSIMMQPMRSMRMRLDGGYGGAA